MHNAYKYYRDYQLELNGQCTVLTHGYLQGYKYKEIYVIHVHSRSSRTKRWNASKLNYTGRMQYEMAS